MEKRPFFPKRKGKRDSKDRRDKKDFLDRGFPIRIKKCRFCKTKTNIIDYKDLPTLEKLISDRGKILSRRITGNCAKHQRKVADAISRARFLALLPYTK